MRLSFLKRRTDTEHGRVRERLSSYLDGHLSARDREETERHLEGCRECRAELDALRATRMVLGSLPRARPPRGFLLEDAPRRPGLPRRFYWLRTATALAAAGLVLLLATPALWSVGGSFTPQPAAGGAQSLGQPGKAGAISPRQDLSTAAPERSQEGQPNPAAAAVRPAPAAAATAPQAAGAAAPVAQPTERPSATPSLAPPAVASRASDEIAGETGAGASPRTLRAPSTRVADATGTATGSPTGSQQPWLLPVQIVAGSLAILLGLATLLVWAHHRRS